jgi:hypothetical protein
MQQTPNPIPCLLKYQNQEIQIPILRTTTVLQVKALICVKFDALFEETTLKYREPHPKPDDLDSSGEKKQELVEEKNLVFTDQKDVSTQQPKLSSPAPSPMFDLMSDKIFEEHVHAPVQAIGRCLPPNLFLGELSEENVTNFILKLKIWLMNNPESRVTLKDLLSPSLYTILSFIIDDFASLSLEDQLTAMLAPYGSTDPVEVHDRLQRCRMRRGNTEHFVQNLLEYINRFNKILIHFPKNINTDGMSIRRCFCNGLAPDDFKHRMLRLIPLENDAKTVSGVMKLTVKEARTFRPMMNERPQHSHEEHRSKKHFSKPKPQFSSPVKHESPKKIFPSTSPSPGPKKLRPLSEVTCFRCKNKGHYANKCTQPHTYQTRSKGPPMVSQQLVASPFYDVFKKDIEVEESLLTVCRLDCGSNISLVSSSVLAKLKVQDRVFTNPTITKAVNGSPVKIKKCISLKIANPENSISLEVTFGIVDSFVEKDVDFLLGADVICHPSHVFPVDSKNMMESKSQLVEESGSLEFMTNNLVADINTDEVTSHVQEDAKRANLEPEQTEELVALVVSFKDLFGPIPDTPAMPEDQMEIKLIEGAKAVYIPPRRLSPEEQEFLSEQIALMLDKKIIRPSKSAWCAPVVIVRKKNGKFRLCQDYRLLNALMIRDASPLPRMDALLDSLGGNIFFVTLDFASGFYQLGIAESSRHLTGFATPDGLFEFLRAPMGLKNSPGVFQAAVNKLLGELRHFSCEVYLDDVIVFGSSWEELLKNLSLVLERLRSGNIRLNLEKCAFGQREVEFLECYLRLWSFYLSLSSPRSRRNAPS